MPPTKPECQYLLDKFHQLSADLEAVVAWFSEGAEPSVEAAQRRFDAGYLQQKFCIGGVDHTGANWDYLHIARVTDGYLIEPEDLHGIELITVKVLDGIFSTVEVMFSLRGLGL